MFTKEELDKPIKTPFGIVTLHRFCGRPIMCVVSSVCKVDGKEINVTFDMIPDQSTVDTTPGYCTTIYEDKWHRPPCRVNATIDNKSIWREATWERDRKTGYVSDVPGVKKSAVLAEVKKIRDKFMVWAVEKQLLSSILKVRLLRDRKEANGVVESCRKVYERATKLAEVQVGLIDACLDDEDLITKYNDTAKARAVKIFEQAMMGGPI